MSRFILALVLFVSAGAGAMATTRASDAAATREMFARAVGMRTVLGFGKVPELATAFRRAGIPVYGVSAQWLRVPNDMRVNQRDERIPVQSLYNGVRHWKIMIRELAGR